MFTGIIQDIGVILKIKGRDYDISTKLNGIKIGDSISVNGVCLTVTNVVPLSDSVKINSYEKMANSNATSSVNSIKCNTLSEEMYNDLLQDETLRNKIKFTVHISKETFDITTFKFLKSGSKVNLEPSLSIGDKISGHLLTGHIDTITHITYIQKIQDSFIYKFKIPQGYKKYIVKKGSIAIDGISLTVADVSVYDFSVVIIPYTYEHTTLKYKKRNDRVNIEFDVLSKYVYSIIKDIR